MSAGNRKATRPAMVGAAVVAVFIAMVYLALTATNGLPGQSYSYVQARFTDVGALRPGDDVRAASVRVGQVRDVRLTEDHEVLVTLQLDGDSAVYRDARAAVRARSSLGQKFVELSAGTPEAGRLGPDEAIATSRTEAPHELDEVLDVLDAPTRGALTSTLREAGGGAAGHSRDLADALGSAPDLLGDLGTVSKAASSRDADLADLLETASTLAGRLAGREQQIAGLVRQTDATLRAIGVDDAGPLATSLREAPETLRTTREALASLDTPLGDTRSAMQRLQPGAVALGKATPDLRGVLIGAVEPLNKVPVVSEQAQPAIDYLAAVFADARPLAPKAAQALHTARTPVEVLAPYSPEIALFFTYFADALKDGDAAGRWLRIDLLANTESVTGTSGVRDPLTRRNPYPAPGEAPRDRTTLSGRG